MADQQIGPMDLVLVSDGGAVYVIKTFNKTQAPPDPQDNAPYATLQELDGDQAVKAIAQANQGILVADLPQDALGGGCTCFLLNLRDLSRLSAAPNTANAPLPLGGRKLKPKVGAKATPKPAGRSAAQRGKKKP